MNQLIFNTWKHSDLLDRLGSMYGRIKEQPYSSANTARGLKCLLEY